MPTPRIGLGHDVHRLVGGRRLVLGGVEIPFDRGLLGHSDADALTHAIMDAILGAAALADIGQHFPDRDPAFKDASSLDLLARVVALVAARGFTVGNVDAIIHAEAPRMAPFRDAMRANLARVLGVPVESVSIKAGTNEGLDAVGRAEAIACQAVVLLKPR